MIENIKQWIRSNFFTKQELVDQGALDSRYPRSTGAVGGQTIRGGTAAGDDLTLMSTSHATKGNIFFGTSTYDEVNNRLGIGTASPSYKLHAQADVTDFIAKIRNTNGTSAGHGLHVDTRWNVPGNYILKLTTNSETNTALVVEGNQNFGFNGASYGGGVFVLFIANANTVPTSNPAGGGILYTEAGSLKYRGSSGTITTLGVA